MEMENAINKLMLGQIEERLIECGIHRIISCVEKLSLEQIQYRPNENSNSIGNQILHLNGNVRQWLIASLTDATDTRERAKEFDPATPFTKESLIELLKNLEVDVRQTYPIIENLDLAATKEVQCYQETVLSILVHVIEHFSYHVGQITYITKMLLDIDTGYYAGLELDKVN
ncbi:MAG: DinB family protein [Bacteroidota bacterium]